ncbi:MAG: signal peptidase I [Oscillospiraceae bacterium]|nr:signal peptidase I [Oscillospiraceae bacterium]
MEELEEQEEYIDKDKKRARVLCDIYEFIESGVTALVFVAILFTFVFRSVNVDGTSMLPTLENKDKLILTNYLFSSPQRGDIVVVTGTKVKNGEPIIKRVIATAGQTIKIDYYRGEVFVNGQKQIELFIKDLTHNQGDFLRNNQEYTVPEDHLFVMGDNRDHSSDSRWRSIGAVHVNQVLGRARLRIWPLNQITFFN